MTTVITCRIGDVAVVRLNRPERFNALTTQMLAELTDALNVIDGDRTCRVVVLTGEGRGFCAGADLNDVSHGDSNANRDPISVFYGQKPYIALCSRIRTLRQPVIAAVNGAAVGGGLALVLASDIRIASRLARFSAAFVKVGLSSADMGVSWMLPRVVPVGVAHDLMLTGRIIDAEEALHIGLVLEVVEPESLLDRALERADIIAANSPFGVAQTKELMWVGLEQPSFLAAMAMEMRTQALANLTEDCGEAAAAFMEKRDPEFHFR